MVFKTSLLSMLITVVLLTGYHFLFNKKTISMAYVDSAKLMTDYQGMKEVKKILESKDKVWQASLDTLAQELQNDIKKYEKERGKMSDREKQTTEELLGRKQQQFMQYKEASKNKVAEEGQKITNEALMKMNAVITEFGKSNNYTIIFGTNSGNIVYANDAINITDEILQELNK
jgi:outer membrane protein